jgi:HPt (histidine-containing phosphotransfer) domain-containing protein
MSDMLAELWAKSRGHVLARVAAIQAAAVALQAGTLSLEERAAAESEAHKLAGVAGTFGYWDATELAREAEGLLDGTEAISDEGCRRLAAIAVLLKEQLEK